MEEIERAFEGTTSILFGKKLSNMQKYGEWLERLSLIHI